MKKRKITALLMAVTMMFGIAFNVNVKAAENGQAVFKGTNTIGVEFKATMDKTSVDVTEKEETVVVTVTANKKVEMDSLGANVLMPDGVVLKSIENDTLKLIKDSDYNLQNGKIAYASSDAENIETDLIIKMVYTVPKGTAAGKYQLGCIIDCISKDYGMDVWEDDVQIKMPLTVEGEAHVHTLNKIEAKQATCTEEGNNEYWECSICGQSFKDKEGKQSTSVQNETIAKLAHTWSEWETDKDKNIRSHRCTVCGAQETMSEDGSSPSRFRDVAQGAYYAGAVEWAVAAGVTSGTTAETFSPDMACSRAQAVTFLYRAAGSPAVSGNNQPFSDVAEGTYYYDAVLWAVENGITTGTSATTFSPDAVCSRAQIVTFLWRSQGTPSAKGENPFNDVKADAYYGAPVLWAVENGITSGTSTTTFSPDTDCSRAQIVTFLYRNYVK